MVLFRNLKNLSGKKSNEKIAFERSSSRDELINKLLDLMEDFARFSDPIKRRDRFSLLTWNLRAKSEQELKEYIKSFNIYGKRIQSNQLLIDTKTLGTFNSFKIKDIDSNPNFLPQEISAYARLQSVSTIGFYKDENKETQFGRKDYFIIVDKDGLVTAHCDKDLMKNNGNNIYYLFNDTNSGYAKEDLNTNFKILDLNYYNNREGFILNPETNTITNLERNIVRKIITNKNGQSVFKIMRPAEVTSRNHISLETGKYIGNPKIILSNAYYIKNNQLVDELERKSGRMDPTKESFVDYWKAGTKKLCSSVNIPESTFFHTYEDGSLHLSSESGYDNWAIYHPSALIKDKNGNFVIQADYPHSVVSEEYYTANGELLNQRLFDYDGYRLLPKAQENNQEISK